MKKLLAIILSVLLISGVMTACQNTTDNKKTNSKLSIVTTIYPEYDWVMNILGDKKDNADVTLLLDNGVDLHSYQPSADDIIKISKCDVFIYVGGESDGWVKDALKQTENKNIEVINLLDVLGNTIKEEEVKEGMMADDDEESSDEDEGPEYDEHVWLSLKNAVTLCKKISESIEKVDKDNKDVYQKNTENYVNSLKELDNKYTDMVSSSNQKTVLFGDRFPFRYLVDDYKLDYFAAFVGCSAETEASFKTISFLANKVDSLGLKSILTIEGKDHKIAKTIIENTKDKNQKILTLDSMQSTTSNDIKNGASYLKIMENNFNVLKEALN